MSFLKCRQKKRPPIVFELPQKILEACWRIYEIWRNSSNFKEIIDMGNIRVNFCLLWRNNWKIWGVTIDNQWDEANKSTK